MSEKKQYSDSPWPKVCKVMDEADKIEKLIQLRLEAGGTREEAMKWAIERMGINKPKPEEG